MSNVLVDLNKEITWKFLYIAILKIKIHNKKVFVVGKTQKEQLARNEAKNLNKNYFFVDRKNPKPNYN